MFVKDLYFWFHLQIHSIVKDPVFPVAFTNSFKRMVSHIYSADDSIVWWWTTRFFLEKASVWVGKRISWCHDGLGGSSGTHTSRCAPCKNQLKNHAECFRLFRWMDLLAWFVRVNSGFCWQPQAWAGWISSNAKFDKGIVKMLLSKGRINGTLRYAAWRNAQSG